MSRATTLLLATVAVMLFLFGGGGAWIQKRLHPPSPYGDPNGANILSWSEDFTPGPWNKYGATVIPEAMASWDGLPIGNKIVGTPGGGGHAIEYTTVDKSGVVEDYTLSVECKAGEFQWCALQLFDHVSNGFVFFHLVGQGEIGYRVGEVTASITPLPDQWYRCVIVVTGNTTTTPWSVWLRSQPADGPNYDFDGDGKRGGYITRACLRKEPGFVSYTKTTDNPAAGAPANK